MRRTTFVALGALVASAVMSACAHNDDNSSGTPRGDANMREHSDVNAIPAPAAPRAEPSQDLLSKMARDLAARLSVKVTEIQVLAVEPVVWDDGSLGCPQPGQSYVTAQTPGIRVLFQHLGKTYQYHASERGHFVHCANPSKPVGGLDER